MELIEILKAVSDESRLRIINLLRDGELCICRIEEVLEMTQSNVSRHLSKLKSVKIVNSRKNAQWVYYSLNDNIFRLYPFLEVIFETELDKIELFTGERKKLNVLTNCKSN